MSTHIKGVLATSGTFQKKNQKKTKDKALSLKERVRVAQSSHESKGEMNNKAKDQRPTDSTQTEPSRIRSRKAAEIDQLLLNLIMENMIDEDYWKFHTKCIYVLGLTKYNNLLIEARAGKKPKNLFAWKLKGALELHYKKQLYHEKHKQN